MVESCPVVVKNLDIRKVTWSRQYCHTAKEAGLKVVSAPKKHDTSAIFIGDSIPQAMLTGLISSAYFLAACEGSRGEEESLGKTNTALLVSTPEVDKVRGLYPHIPKNKLYVAGFPINLDRLREYASCWDSKIPRSVCFLGETREVKNPKFEIELAGLLIHRGYRCFHFSPTSVSIRDQLENLGVTVLEGLRDKRYYKTATKMRYVVNTSYRESLFVSGIEAAVLGAIPIVPQQETSGFIDWCPSQLMYEYPQAESALRLISDVDALISPKPDIEKYHYKEYFARVIRRIEDSNA